MNKLNKIITTRLCAGILSISAASAARYVGYKLTTIKGNNYTSVFSKTSSVNYITNTIENVEGTSTVTFWANNPTNRQISNDYDQKKGNTLDIKFTIDGYDAKGTQNFLGMENASCFYSTAFCAETVNFR